MRGNAAFEHNTIDAIIKSANHGNIAPIDNLSDIIMSSFFLYAFSLARSIGHRLRNATVFCLWPSSPFLSRCTPSLLYLFLCLSARCFVAYLFFSSLGVVFGTLSVHFKCSILRRHLLMKVCIFFSVFCVVRHVSAP